MLRVLTVLALAMPVVTAAAAADKTFCISQPFESKVRDKASRRTTRSLTVPPCTPLRFTPGGAGGKPEAYVFNPRWGEMTVKRELVAPAVRFDSIADCIAAAETYRERYGESQVADFVQGTLTLGMPIEWASIALGPWRVLPGGSVETPEGPVHRWDRISFGDSERNELDRATIKRLESAAWGEIRVSPDDRSIAAIAVLESVKVAQSKERVAFDRGMALYRSGDADGALALWVPLAESGYCPAQYSVGDMYLHGDAVATDVEEALRWFRAAADRYYPAAMYQLGYAYAQGNGLKRDLIEAFFWISFAANLGDENAKVALPVIEARLSPEELAAARARVDAVAITAPRRIPGDYLAPDYPELARVARIEARVVLSASISEDGIVDDVEVVRVDRPNLGFEQAALAAIRHWKYEPATFQGRPVRLYFTIVVDFDLQ